MADELNNSLRRLRDDAQAGDTFSMLESLRAETDPGLLAVERLENLAREDQQKLQAKLQRMQAGNPGEPKWEASTHWPLLKKLNELLSSNNQTDGPTHVFEKDRRRS